MSTAKASASWKNLLLTQRRLKVEGIKFLFRRVELLVKMFKDNEFLEHAKVKGQAPVDILSAEVDDTCANFTELHQIYLKFPKEVYWREKGLMKMKSEVIEGMRKSQNQRKKADNGRHNRTTATLAQVKKLQEDVATSKSETERLRDQLKAANQIIKSLESQLEAARETIGSLNETITLFKMDKRGSAKRTVNA